MLNGITMLLVLALIGMSVYIGIPDDEEEHQPWADPEAEKELREWNK